jgi:hypothetical protein
VPAIATVSGWTLAAPMGTLSTLHVWPRQLACSDHESQTLALAQRRQNAFVHTIVLEGESESSAFIDGAGEPELNHPPL